MTFLVWLLNYLTVLFVVQNSKKRRSSLRELLAPCGITVRHHQIQVGLMDIAVALIYLCEPEGIVPEL
ncbi:hypothetical protein [Burkholderia glumae]|uniref:hypothetical protein n=1 Tax=Burkholderia glumae TaxID=337 RepID=UPI00157B5B8D|nr:hypothetical protein [Burkholderia glumae]